MSVQKRRKEIEAMAKRAGVSIVEYSYTGGGHIGVLVEADNGNKKRFSCSVQAGDYRADKNQESYFRQFARANLDRETVAHQPQTLEQHIAADDVQQPEPITQPTKQTMTTTPATPAAKKYQTTHIEFFKLCEWLKITNLTGVYTIPRCMELATPALGFPVPYTAIQSALEATGIKLPERPANEPAQKRDRTHILAKELAALLVELGKEPSADLLSIVNRTGG